MGAGQEAAAIADIKNAITIIAKAMNAFPVFDARRKTLIRALESLESKFGKEPGDLQPASLKRMAQMGQSGQGLAGHNMPPPGIQLGGPAPMPMTGGGGGGAGQPPPGLGG